MNKKRIFIAIISFLLLIVAYFYFTSSENEEILITAKVKKGDFLSEVIVSGEARSTSSKKINGPSNLRKFPLRDLKIQDLIPEGTVIKEGDYVGKLDPSGVNEKILDAELNLESAVSKFTQKKLDTTLTLKQERTAIQDLQFSIDRKKLELEQSIYEPKAKIQELEVDVTKATRDLKEKKEDYDIKKRQARAQMIEVGTEVSKYRTKLESLNDLLKSFTIFSESDGMVIYDRNWDGSKKEVGSNISAWNPTIATLPDLTKMESKTYANEVDVGKIKKGLSVKIGFDAFPDLFLKGEVMDVANVGENKRGSDIKIFQVLIKILETNENIRPGMTTSNNILTYEEKDVLTIPLEGIFVEDSISYVYKKSGFDISKKEIKLGESNNTSIIVKEGLSENDVIYLNKPEGYDNESIIRLNK